MVLRPIRARILFELFYNTICYFLQKKKKRISEDLLLRNCRNTTILLVTVTWLTFQSSISFATVIFLIMSKARRSSYTMAFRIKVVAEAEAVENSSEIAWDYGLSESMVRRWRRDQATILSGKLKMSVRRTKMSRFTLKCPELDEQAMQWFSQQRDQIFHL